VRLPSKDQLEYVRLLLTCALLCIAFPLVLFHIWREPGHAADRVLGGAAR
jgi:hypothetical protein